MRPAIRTGVLAALVVILASGSSRAQRIVVADEIRYPTSYREQSVESMIDSRYRVPIPENFETRTVGVSQTVSSVGAVGTKVVVRNPPQTFFVVFPDGTEAEFQDGVTTVVKGVPYRGAGFRFGMYRVQNMLTGDIVYFKAPRPNR